VAVRPDSERGAVGLRALSYPWDANGVRERAVARVVVGMHKRRGGVSSPEVLLLGYILDFVFR